MSRTKMLAKNIKWSYVGSIATTLMGILVRTVFVYTLGTTMLGINSLYASILGVLSIAELGIGAILNTQLYQPVAEKDEKTVVGIMQLYRKVYLMIALIIAVVGVFMIPFLHVFMKDADAVPYVEIYYLFFLFNTVITYLTSYKFSISNAEQKNYINTNFETLFNLLVYVGQAVVLLVFRNYLLYLLVQTIILLVKAMSISWYMNKQYPVLRSREKVTLDDEKMKMIKKYLFAVVFNRFSDTAINQTDSMIISSFVSVNSLGMVSNYTALRTYVERFTKPLLDNSGSVVGNFVNVESEERKCLLIKSLQLYGFWIYGVVSLMLYFLATPFVEVWLGKEYMISDGIVFVICLNLMLSGVGDRPYVIFKNSHGRFYDDWHVVIASAIVNLVVSITLVIPFGIVGVFLGTTCTILVSVFGRPFIFYKQATGEAVGKYIGRVVRNFLIVFLTGCICVFVFRAGITIENRILELIYRGFVVFVVSNVCWLLLFYRTEEFKYLKKLAFSLLKK